MTVAPNQSPTAAFTSANNLVASFMDSSSDPDGTIASYAWDFGDGSSGTGSSPVHPYAASGKEHMTAILTVTDGRRRDGSADASSFRECRARPVPS